ncbi:MAG: small basic protein [Candidatus Omnitrophica bacterium]|nr:small basic protein [Candidatus Omnitrophota bacterium]MBI3009843.1 small basic protein [Candidatus Omnitrophota bacterium]
MSVHSSLRTEKGGLGTFRSVIKRYERVRHLMSSEKWVEGQSVLGLPKLKQVKMKSRKAAPKEAEAAAAGQPATPSGQATPASGSASS